MQNRRKKQGPLVKKETNTSSSIFDTAIPLALRDKAHASPSKTPHITTDAQVPLSPYVVRLSHPHTPVYNPKKQEDDDLQDLMNQLLNTDIEPEALQEPEVLVDFLDLVDQIREDMPIATTDLRIPKHQNQMLHTASLPLVHTVDNQIDIATIFDPKNSFIESKKEIEEEPVIYEAEPENNSQEEFTKKKDSFLFFFPNSTRHRITATFIALSLLFVAPIHAMQSIGALPALGAKITGSGSRATSQLKNGSSAMFASDFFSATNEFEHAIESFEQIDTTVKEATKKIGLLATVIPQSGRALRTTNALVDTGESLSSIGHLLSLAMNDINQQISFAPTEKINLFLSYFEKMNPFLQSLSKSVKHIDINIIPSDQQDIAKHLFAFIPSLIANTEHTEKYLRAFYTLLGGEEQKTYLLVFQNNAELRPTGGFMGSFAELTVNKGIVEKIIVPEGGTYDIQGQVSTFLAPPDPLRIINPRWEFQDANWFPDFRISAKKILAFHASAGGPTMDGVIAINASTLPSILSITGPVMVDNILLNSENVLFELQKRDADTQDAPKKLLSNLTQVLFAKLKEADAKTLLALSDVTISALAKQDIQLYMKDETLAQTIAELHWNGAQLPYSFDTLQVIDTNIGGGKSDSVIDQNITLHADVAEDGTVTNTLTITKTHKGIASSLLQGVNNVDYMRVYVPRNSIFLSAEGFDEQPPQELFEISDIPLQLDQDIELATQSFTHDPISKTDIFEENGFTVFGNWIQTKPGETETVTIRYQLPHALAKQNTSSELLKNIRSQFGLKNISTYSLVIQKQPGADRRRTSFSMTYPPTWNLSWNALPTEILSNQTSHVVQALFEYP